MCGILASEKIGWEVHLGGGIVACCLVYGVGYCLQIWYRVSYMLVRIGDRDLWARQDLLVFLTDMLKEFYSRDAVWQKGPTRGVLSAFCLDVGV